MFRTGLYTWPIDALQNLHNISRVTAAAEEVLHWDNNVIISLHVQLGAPTESEMHLDSESEINGKSYIYQATQTFAIYVQLILAHRS